MATIGLYVDLNQIVKDSTKVEKVRKLVLKRFNIDPDLQPRVDIYRMVPLRSHEEISDSDMLVAHVPGSKLDAPTIENLIQSHLSNQSKLDEANKEVSDLRRRLASSESTRTEAIQTIDLLRNEFTSLLEDLKVDRLRIPTESATARMRNAAPPIRSARVSYRARPTQRSIICNSRN